MSAASGQKNGQSDQERNFNVVSHEGFYDPVKFEPLNREPCILTPDTFSVTIPGQTKVPNE